jgi:hypothetical protein
MPSAAAPRSRPSTGDPHHPVTVAHRDTPQPDVRLIILPNGDEDSTAVSSVIRDQREAAD